MSSGFTRWLKKEGGMLAVLLLIFLLASIFVPNFLTILNMKGLALAVSMVGMVAATMVFCLAAGHFDLSVESLVASTGVLVAIVINQSGSIGLGIMSGIFLGAGVGLINGAVIAKLKINALITTLATMQIVRGLGFIISNGKAVGIKDEGFYVLGDSIGSVPIPVLLCLLSLGIFGVLLSRTILGRSTLAIGGNQEAARLSGIPVDATLIGIFMVQGMIAAFAGIVLASRMTSGQPMAAQGFALEVISACVLGGVSLTGGIGSMTGVIVGVLILGIVQNSMNLLNIPPFYQYVARGLILLAAVLFDRFKQLKLQAKP